MPFRFRRIISLGKGFRINLSKSGISSSIGGKGLTVNLSKRGVRPTVSAPGTGISYTPSMASADRASAKNANQLIALIIGGIGLICIIIFCCILLFIPEQDPTPTSTPASKNQEVPPIVPIIIPESTQANSNTCSCASDLYNCSDFSTHSQAQSCFNYCVSQGYGDIHKLDQNNDGLACESIP